MEYASLTEMLSCLEAGTKLHICVVFLKKYLCNSLNPEPSQKIHIGKICHEMKARPGGLNRCVRCRDRALEKAIRTKSPFWGTCINGIYEYVRPVVKDENIICVIFVGNLLPQQEKQQRLLERIGNKKDFLSTLESQLDPAQCESIGKIVESYIRMLTVLEPSAQGSTAVSALIETVKKYACENLEYEISLPIIARMLHYNEKYLGRQFKAQMGICFSEYLNRIRVERAKELLLCTDSNVIDIALSTGFRNVSYFNRTFKCYLGVTPTEIRQQRKTV